jgi:hypothetical protein
MWPQMELRLFEPLEVVCRDRMLAIGGDLEGPGAS